MKSNIDWSGVKNYFVYSKKEQRGLIVLTAMIFLALAMNLILPLFYQENLDDFLQFMDDVEKFEASLAVKAGKSNPGSVAISPDTTGEKKVPEKEKIQRKEAVKNELLIELNSCDSADLIKLKGIGPVFSKRIIKYRNLLGGYYDPVQLLEVYGMDSARLLPILSSFTCDTTKIKKIDLNNVEFRQLLKHPYFEYETVKAIFNYKRDNNGFGRLSDLKRVEGFTGEIYDRVVKYLWINPKSQ